jgi:hypothetical protein
VKIKLVTNISKNTLTKGHDLRCLKVVKKDFGPVGALHASITKTYLGEK